MPDIKTALSTVLSQWEQDEQKQINQEKPLGKHLFKPVNNVTRETFNYIKNNPNKTTAEVCEALEKLGFKESSVNSICAQLSKQGQVVKDGYTKRMVAVGTDYIPLKSASAFKTQKPETRVIKIVKREKPTQNAGLASIAPKEDTTRKAALIFLNDFDPNDVVNKLSVVQARELYDLLKKIFGG